MLPRVNIDFKISLGDSRFCGNVFKPSQREIPESTESMQGNPRKQFVFLSHESVVGLNSLLMKFFYYVTWFDQRRNRRSCKQGSLEENSKRFIVTITKTDSLP